MIAAIPNFQITLVQLVWETSCHPHRLRERALRDDGLRSIE